MNPVSIASYRTTIGDILDLKEQYDCDIIEVYERAVHGMCAPQPIQEGILDTRYELSVSEMFMALDDYFSAYMGNGPEPEPFPTYADCEREEWKNILLEVHESLVNPELTLDYDIVERDLQRLCSGSGVPENVVSELCEVARNGFSERIKLLCFYRELIFAIEEKRYEDAADLRNKITKIKN